jgi:hypothetical protein
MTAPFRIHRPDKRVGKVASGGDEGFKFYLDRFMKLIPGEAVGLYLIGSGFIPKGGIVNLALSQQRVEHV